jgi:hypothetical protein
MAKKKEKQYCAICGKEIIGFEKKRPVVDGIVCDTCYNRKGIYRLPDISNTTTKAINQYLSNRMEWQKSFCATEKIPKSRDEVFIALDSNAQIFQVLEEYFKFDNLESYDLHKTYQETVSKGGTGRAVAGGLLFGPVGAIVGSVTGEKKLNAEFTSATLTIKFKNHLIPSIKFFLPSEDVADLCVSLLEKIKLSSKAQPTIERVPNSAADEIMKFKQLLDANIITQEEFEAKKRQLLGL